MITLEEIQTQLKYLEDGKKDPEVAHSQRDYLWECVLEAIVEGAENPKELAEEALKSEEIDFPRWCA